MTYLAGLGLGLSLIVAIGAQNVFVLRQGLRRERVGTVVLICTLSDIALIAAGVAGVGAAIVSVPWLLTAARWAGAAFLMVYAVLAARRALQPGGERLEADDAGVAHAPSASASGSAAASAATGDRTASTAAASATAATDAGDTGAPLDAPAVASSAGAVAVTCLALTWLNPHVYLDTVVLLGTVASTHDARWLFAAGAMTGSAVWFVALGYGARLLAGVLASPRAWRILDGAIALVMMVLAVSLAAGA